MKYLSGIAFAAVFALAACGDGEKPADPAADPAIEATDAVEEEECEGPNCNTGGNGRPIEELGRGATDDPGQ